MIGGRGQHIADRANAQSRRRRNGAIQTLGGRNKGGMAVSAILWNRPGVTRLLTSGLPNLAVPGTSESGWKHLSKQLLMSGQTLAQWGQDLWQGLSSDWSAMTVMLALATASAIPAGMATSAMTMARRPSATKQRCSALFTTLP
jgi:hypothetical protein